jgi:hypothetical protein
MSKDIINYYQAVLADLESERDRLNAMIEGTKARIRSLGGMLIAPPIAPVPTKTVRRKPVPQSQPQPSQVSRATNLPYEGLTIFDAAKKYLETTSEPQSGGQIWEALTKGGLPTIHYNAVYTALWRKRAPEGEFVKEGSGQNARWSLKDSNQTQPKAPSVTSQPQPRGRGGTSIMDYCVRILQDANRPLHAQVLVSKLAEKGCHTTVDSMSSTFRRDSRKRFQNMGLNTWALSEWPDEIKNQGRREAQLPL